MTLFTNVAYKIVQKEGAVPTLKTSSLLFSGIPHNNDTILFFFFSHDAYVVNLEKRNTLLLRQCMLSVIYRKCFSWILNFTSYFN